MTSRPAALSAVYTDYRRVKSRKVHQIVFELPSEKWAEAYRVLGEPSIETSEWFAIAKLQVPAEPAPAPKDVGSNLAANAALMLKEPAFQAFLVEKGIAFNDVDHGMKVLLHINSKAQLNTDPAAAARWRELRSTFEAWRRT